MTTFALLAVILIAAVLLWLVPMDATLRKILIAVVVVSFVLWLLWVLNLLPWGGGTIVVHDRY